MTIEARPRGAEKTRRRPGRGASRQREAPSRPDDFLVVCLGASAGGLEALSKLFDAHPPDTGMAFVLIQHLDPTHKSMMVGLLAGHTSMKVLEAAEDMPIERDHVYVMPPGVYLSVCEGAFRLSQPRERHGARMPFDFFLRSLAEDCGERAVCAVLSGSGGDGSLGLTAIHDKGGLVIVQDPKEAAHDGMPRSAIMTGAADLVLPVVEIPAALVKFSRQAHPKPERAEPALGNGADAGLDEIIDLLRAHTSHDFAFYKEGTLRRQIERRMAMSSIKDIGVYLNTIRKNPDEIDLLAKAMLINVTRFFRDEETFAVLAQKVVSPARIERFFTTEDHGCRVTRELRETVVFTTQDLLADAPFSRLDFVSCRNVLIYLRPEVQQKVLSLFHFALHEGGILVLGASEAMGDFADRFEPISKKQRIFRHLGRSRPGEVEFPIAPSQSGRTTHPSSSGPRSAPPRTKASDLARQVLLDAHAPASVLINAKHEGLFYFGPIDRYLKVAAGEASRDLFAMARDGLRTKLRAAIRQAGQQHARVAVGGAQVDRNGDAVAVSVSVQPLQTEDEEFLLVSFSDEPERKKSSKEGAQAADPPHVVQLEQELDATRKELESAIHDLETTNDELTATNEEAMSVNEELQSTNEELETSKEELQSLNEELTALNSQLNETIERQRATANDLQNTMNSSEIAMLFLDGNLEIRLFTPAARSMFSVIASDIGRPLADLARRINDARLLADANAVLAGNVPPNREVERDDGAWYTRREIGRASCRERV